MASRHDSTKKPQQSDVPELTLEREFDAPRDLVFDSWVDPELLAQWSSPRDYSIPEASSDVRAGGKWRAVFRPLSGGGRDLVVEGVYREVLPPERIVSTHTWLDERGKPGPETLMIVTLEDHGDRTLMTFRQSGFATREDRDGHAAGWKECFDKLGELLAERVETSAR